MMQMMMLNFAFGVKECHIRLDYPIDLFGKDNFINQRV
ncbi:hypothetical protein LEP1GSC125_1069 [Leptospira mayottensis 200901122]|uniref:Uncharacterized protein n=1 Tax=Leptospira mayottensis 200901122 TaxID=1193010 RepID=A0AA87SUL1_9LEPT|nr:hypothetical protein LEP1GSC125_1069 [Leptospira mayottensis 200901122]